MFPKFSEARRLTSYYQLPDRLVALALVLGIYREGGRWNPIKDDFGTSGRGFGLPNYFKL